ncbi:MAG: hypothetical protein J6O49_18305 [Bacteroidaceae bacterium]|nr:hypothetical protein [Bacteroidaceae bacterium]
MLRGQVRPYTSNMDYLSKDPAILASNRIIRKASLPADAEKIMQHVSTKQDFSYCGIIHIATGDERLAYQRII